MQKFRKVIAIAFIVVIGLIVVIGISESETTEIPTTPEKIDFEVATYEEKQAYLQAYLKNPDQSGFDMQEQMANQIKKRFNNPKTVRFGSTYPLLSNGRVVEADSGWVFIDGKGTAENAFKQESNFTYTVKLKITDKTINIEDIQVNQ